MSKALELIERHGGYGTLKDGVQWTVSAVLAKDPSYTLFRSQDWPAWVIFSSVFLVLIIFDNVILHRNPYALTVTRAIFYTLFWMLAAAGFCLWVAWWKGEAAAYMWMSGYMLEWMLSFDNLFVFHLIFTVYGTPDQLKHRPLYLGIMGAVAFRLIFIFIGEYLMHAMTFMHLVFGMFLVYTGIKTVTTEEEDEDPSQLPLVMWLQRKVPFISLYDAKGAFFVSVPINERGEAQIPEDAYTQVLVTENSPILGGEEGEHSARYPVVDFSAASIKGSGQRFETRATMLFLVVCCLEISDLLFAVDSVSAIVAQVNDLFLAYTSAVFAMLGLRATFFIIDVLVQLFSLLKYGVGAILVFIGVKLIIGKYYHIPPSIVCAVLVSAVAGSMVASVIQDKFQKKYEGVMSPEVAERVAKVKMMSPWDSPLPLKSSPKTL